MMKPDSVLILGTGAMATLFAARFSAVGIKVNILGTWQEGLSVLRQNGAQLDGIGSYPIQTKENPVDCRWAKYALVLVKSWQTERAALQLSECLAEDGVALSLQNGLGNDAVLAKTLGMIRIARGVTTMGASLIAPGIVHLAGDGPVSLEAHPRLAPLQEMLLKAGFDVNVTSNVRSLVWGKLVVSTAINPLTALLRVKNGELIEHPSSRELMGALAKETASVAAIQGVALPFSDPVHVVEEVARNTAENQSSMLQDVLRGSPTEIDAINGAVVRLAEEGRFQVPVNRVILSLVKALPVRGKI
jgi:2-dehydropantoate 2-reductase